MKISKFNIKIFFLTISIVSILSGIIIISLQPLLFNFLCIFIKIHLSSNNSIETRIKYKLWQLLYTAGVFFILTGIIALILRNNLIRDKIKSLISDDYHTETGKFNLFLASSITGIFFAVIYQPLGSLFFGGYKFRNSFLKYLYGEDCLFETMTAILLIISSIMLFNISLSLIYKKQKNLKFNFIFLIYFFLSLAFFFLAMEEISWGQRIFGWETPLLLKSLNIQKETNLHNILISFNLLYKCVSIALLLLLLLSFLIQKNESPDHFYNLILPHPCMITLTFLIVFSSFTGQHELVEELAAIFSFFYSYRCIKNMNRLLKTENPLDKK
jgi:hypothetical protein